jgi:hypothetical protein
VYTSIDEDNTAWIALYSFSVSSLFFTDKVYTLLDRDKKQSFILTQGGIYSFSWR